MRKTLASLFAATLAIGLGGEAMAQESVTGAITRTMKQLERGLCEGFDLRNCKARQSATKAKTDAKSQDRVNALNAGEKSVPKPKTKPTSLAKKPAVKTEPKTVARLPEQSQVPLPRLKPQNVATAATEPSDDPALRKSDSAALAQKTAEASTSAKEANKLPTTGVTTGSITRKINPPKPELRGSQEAAIQAPPPKSVKETKTGKQPDCFLSLAKAGINFKPAAIPVSTGKCAVENPVKLESVDILGGKVKLSDKPTLNCEFALSLSLWLQEEAAYIVKTETGQKLASLSTGPGFDCRGRNGDSNGKLSEHAFGNAVDIEKFKLENGTTISIKDAPDPKAKGYAAMKALRASACAEFSTVLGPGADAAHAEHFHFDLAARKGGYRICE